MNKIEYKILELPKVSLKNFIFKRKTYLYDYRNQKLEEDFNSLGQEGWKLVNIYWLEGVALFERELQSE